jgi:hypothetical protein
MCSRHGINKNIHTEVLFKNFMEMKSLVRPMHRSEDNNFKMDLGGRGSRDMK